MKTGQLIALEGIDGTGKGTQARLLVEALERRGQSVAFFSFPAYRQTFAGALIGDFLDGRLGDPKGIDSRLTATIYALDRFELRDELRRALMAGQTVVCDRYVGSNLAHQVARARPGQREAVRSFIEALEFTVLGLPRADLTLYLDMPVGLAQRRVLTKAARQYTKKRLDANEADLRHLRGALAEYRHQSLAPDWRRIATTRGRRELTRDEIHAAILAAIDSALPRPGNP